MLSTAQRISLAVHQVKLAKDSATPVSNLMLAIEQLELCALEPLPDDAPTSRYRAGLAADVLRNLVLVQTLATNSPGSPRRPVPTPWACDFAVGLLVRDDWSQAHERWIGVGELINMELSLASGLGIGFFSSVCIADALGVCPGLFSLIVTAAAAWDGSGASACRLSGPVSGMIRERLVIFGYGAVAAGPIGEISIAHAERDPSKAQALPVSTPASASDVVDIVRDVLDGLVAEGLMFTALDVTKYLRDEKGYTGRHGPVRLAVASLFRASPDGLFDDYTTEQIDVTDANGAPRQATLYMPADADPDNYTDRG